jgi:hypothetical protein
MQIQGEMGRESIPNNGNKDSSTINTTVQKKKKNLKSTEKGGKPKECLAMHINSMNIYLACPQTPWNVELVQSPAFFMMWKASYS